MARRRPAFTCDIAAGAGAKVKCVSPATTEATEGPPPLCGTCSASNPPICVRITPARWLVEPTPAEAMLTLPLFARANSTSSFTDLTPFLESGCEVSVLQTFLLDCSRPSDELWTGMRDKTRNVVRRARERLMVKDIDDADLFVSFYRSNLDGEKCYFNLGLVRGLFEAAHVRGQGKIAAAIDSSGMVHAKVFFVWDDQRLYYFLSTRDRKVADVGAVSLLLWHGIELAHARKLTFDFDGITNEARFAFMAGFGGEIATRFNIVRTTRLYEAQKGIRNVARAILKPDWLRS